MPKYTVSLTKHLMEEVEVEADNKKEAVMKACVLHQDLEPEGVTELDANGDELGFHYAIASCEGCDEPILEGEWYSVNHDEGHYCCSKCLDATKAEVTT